MPDLTTWPPEPTTPEERWAAARYDRAVSHLLRDAETLPLIWAELGADPEVPALPELGEVIDAVERGAHHLRRIIDARPPRDLPTAAEVLLDAMDRPDQRCAVCDSPVIRFGDGPRLCAQDDTHDWEASDGS